MNETVASYINMYCDENHINCEKTKNNECLINNKKMINIEDGFTYIYKSLSKIAKSNKIIENIKSIVKFK